MKLGEEGCEVVGSLWEELGKEKALIKTYCANFFRIKKLKRCYPW